MQLSGKDFLYCHLPTGDYFSPVQGILLSQDTGDWPGSRRVAVRLRGFTSTTMVAPADSQSATFSSTSAKRSLGEMTSTARSGAPGK